MAIIEDWNDGPEREHTFVSQLSAGVHNLQVDYYQNQGGAKIQFGISSLGPTGAWEEEIRC